MTNDKLASSSNRSESSLINRSNLLPAAVTPDTEEEVVVFLTYNWKGLEKDSIKPSDSGFTKQEEVVVLLTYNYEWLEKDSLKPAESKIEELSIIELNDEIAIGDAPPTYGKLVTNK